MLHKRHVFVIVGSNQAKIFDHHVQRPAICDLRLEHPPQPDRTETRITALFKVRLDF